MERGRIRALPKFFGYPLSGTGKATDFKFCRNIQRVDPNKSPWKMLGIVAVGVVRESRIFFRAPTYRAHCAVMFAKLRQHCFHIVPHWLLYIEIYTASRGFPATARLLSLLSSEALSLTSTRPRSQHIFFIFTARCTMHSAKRGLAIACRLSVRPSVRLWRWWFVIT